MKGRTLFTVAAAIAAFASCGNPSFDDGECGESVPLTMMSYNLANESGAKLDAIVAHIVATNADFVAVQECPCDDLLTRLPDNYRLSEDPKSGVTIVYDHSKWTTLYSDFVTLGQNDDGWGDRVLHWARFSHRDTGHCVNVYSTHFCVSIRSPDDSCDVQRQLEYLATSFEFIRNRQSDRALTLLAGDFNVFDGFEEGPVVQKLKDSGFSDLLRQFDDVDRGPTFVGNTWADAGRIDYIFSDSPLTLLDGYVDRSSVPDGEGSDHYAIVSTLEFARP